MKNLILVTVLIFITACNQQVVRRNSMSSQIDNSTGISEDITGNTVDNTETTSITENTSGSTNSSSTSNTTTLQLEVENSSSNIVSTVSYMDTYKEAATYPIGGQADPLDDILPRVVISNGNPPYHISIVNKDQYATEGYDLGKSREIKVIGLGTLLDVDRSDNGTVWEAIQLGISYKDYLFQYASDQLYQFDSFKIAAFIEGNYTIRVEDSSGQVKTITVRSRDTNGEMDSYCYFQYKRASANKFKKYIKFRSVNGRTSGSNTTFGCATGMALGCIPGEVIFKRPVKVVKHSALKCEFKISGQSLSSESSTSSRRVSIGSSRRPNFKMGYNLNSIPNVY